MLKKLTKYEFKATGRTLGIFYIALIVMACVCRLIFGLSEIDSSTGYIAGVSGMILIFLYGMMICAVLIVTFLMIIQRFWKNLLQNEGYLMNMLPVKSWQHIASKLLVSVVWTFVSVLVVVLSILILSTLAMQDVTLAMLGDMWSQIVYVFSHMGVDGTYVLIMTVVILILATAAEVLQLYAAMAVGQTRNRYKVLSSFGVYIIISVIFQLAVSIITWISGYVVADGLAFLMTANNFIYAGTAATAVYFLAKCAILFFTTNYFLKNKLNLE